MEFEIGGLAVLPSSVSFWTTGEEVMSAGDPVGQFTNLLKQTARSSGNSAIENVYLFVL